MSDIKKRIKKLEEDRGVNEKPLLIIIVSREGQPEPTDEEIQKAKREYIEKHGEPPGQQIVIHVQNKEAKELTEGISEFGIFNQDASDASQRVSEGELLENRDLEAF